MKDKVQKNEKDVVVGLSSNVLDIIEGSSSAEIMLNERFFRMSDEERVKEAYDGMLSFLTKSFSSGDKSKDEECLLLMLEGLQNVFRRRHFESIRDNDRDHNLCLRQLYSASISENDESKLEFPKAKKRIWEMIMEDWDSELPADEWNQKLLVFFMDRYFKAGPEEQKIMSDIFRQRLANTEYKHIETWVKWLNDPTNFNPVCFQSEMGRRWAMARASNGGWSLLLQDIRGGELLRALDRPEGFPAHLMRALREVGDQIIDIDEAAKSLVEELKETFHLEKVAKERIDYVVYDNSLVEIKIFCVCFHASEIEGDGGRDCQEMIKHARVVIKQKGYEAEDGGVLLSGHRVTLLLKICDIDGYGMCKGRFPKVK